MQTVIREILARRVCLTQSLYWSSNCFFFCSHCRQLWLISMFVWIQNGFGNEMKRFSLGSFTFREREKIQQHVSLIVFNHHFCFRSSLSHIYRFLSFSFLDNDSQAMCAQRHFRRKRFDYTPGKLALLFIFSRKTVGHVSLEYVCQDVKVSKHIYGPFLKTVKHHAMLCSDRISV